jgi:hypothetical protein
MDYASRVRYSDFRQACRAHKPSELLPYLASFSARKNGLGKLQIDVMKSTPPWTVAAIARESLLWGNEHRDKPVTWAAVAKLFNLIRDVEVVPEQTSLMRIMTPIVQEQFAYWRSPQVEMARALAVLDTSWPGLPDLDWTKVFGMSLAEMIRATELVGVAAVQMDGRVDLGRLFGPGMERVATDLLPREEADLALRYLTRTPQEHKAEAQAAGVLDARAGEYAYNPLRSAPFVDFGDGVPISPEPRLIWQAITLGTLYYVGPKYFGDKKFHTDLGHRMSHYVGQQLQQIEGAEVFPELAYDSQNAMTIDWFVVLPEVVLLVECKSARLNAMGLTGDEEALSKTVARYFDKARQQIDTTARHVQRGEPRLGRVPLDRPLLGITVTAEDIYMANYLMKEFGQDAVTPTLVASLAEIEAMVTLPTAEIGKRLVAICADAEQSTWSLKQSLGEGMDPRRNALLTRVRERSNFLRDEAGHRATDS